MIIIIITGDELETGHSADRPLPISYPQAESFDLSLGQSALNMGLF